MRLVICETIEEFGEKAAQAIAAQIRAKSNSVLGLPTGDTPIRVYNELVKLYNENYIDFQYVTTFNLDEYLGMDKENPSSYNYFMWNNLFRHINISNEKVHIPDGKASDPHKECSDYEDSINGLGGLDLMVLGIGLNGHIGFNEPGTNFDSRTRVVELAESTISANARNFNSSDEVPRQAITMGIATIMAAKKILLLATGEGKAQIVYDAFNKNISTEIPASVLQYHKDVHIILDKEAGRYFK